MPRGRPRPRRVIGPVLILAALAYAVALLGMPHLPGWLRWMPSWGSVGLVAVLGVVGVRWAEPWAKRRESLADAEWEAVGLLRRHLGRRDDLPRVGRRTGLALALRVHPAIRATGGAPDPDLPAWVERDKGPEVYAALREAAGRGGFVLLVGDSSVGKTRLLYEAVERELPGWAVLAPDLGDGALVNTVATAAFKLPKLVVWLDELQRYLDGPYLTSGSTAITADAVRHLLDSPEPVVIVGTLWPDHVHDLRGTEPDPETRAPRARYQAAVDILDDRRRREITIQSFSTAERTSAATLAGTDSRLAEALADRTFNVTEVLAGAPQLIRRYEQATDELHAVLRAALDARRVGIRAPLTEASLLPAARAYLTGVRADDDWFAPALTELARPDQGVAPLVAVPDAERRSVQGYDVADYLLQYANRRHRTDRVPAGAWRAFIDHTDDLDDLRRLASAAHDRLCYRAAELAYLRLSRIDHRQAGNAAWQAGELMERQERTGEAIEHFTRAADADDLMAPKLLAMLLARLGRTDDLRRRADAGDEDAASHLISLLGRTREAADALRDWTGNDDRSFAWWAQRELAGLLSARGDVESLRARALEGDFDCANSLARLLKERGDLDGAIEVWRAGLDAGEQWAAIGMSDLLSGANRKGEAVAVLETWLESARSRDSLGRQTVHRALVDLYVGEGLIDKALDMVRADPEAVGWDTGDQIVRRLTERGDLDGLRSLADGGNDEAKRWARPALAAMLGERGELEELRSRAESGEWEAALHLADLLTGQGEAERAIAMFRRLADDLRPGGLTWASKRLARMLAERGDEEELRTRADDGDRDAANHLAELLAERGDLDGLWARARAGDRASSRRLIDQADPEGLQVLAEAGDHLATRRLIERLADHGDLDRVIALLTASADSPFIELSWRDLAGRTGDDRVVAALRGRLAEGHEWAAPLLVEVFGRTGDVAGLRELARTGSSKAVEALVEALSADGDVTGLRAEVDAGTPGAAHALIRLLESTGRAEEADRLYRYGLDAES